MKNLWKVTSISLIWLLLVSCTKQDKMEEVYLGYTMCPCDHEVKLIKSYSFKTVNMFDSSRINFDEMQNKSYDGSRSIFIAYSKKTGIAIL